MWKMLEKMEKRMKIKEILKASNSIFTHMNYDFEIIDSSQLDLLFVLNYGERSVSPLLNYYIRDGTLPLDSLDEVASTILAFYNKKWDKLKDVLKLKYDVIHNFSDELVEKIDSENTSTFDKNSTSEDTEETTNTRTDDLTTSESRETSNSQSKEDTAQIQAFNSTSYQNKDKETLTSSSTDNTTSSIKNTGTQANSENKSITTSNENHEESSDKFSNTRTTTRIGNIGNITTQQMLNQEIELWKWNFIKQVLDDVKELCTLSIYV